MMKLHILFFFFGYSPEKKKHVIIKKNKAIIRSKCLIFIWKKKIHFDDNDVKSCEYKKELANDVIFTFYVWQQWFFTTEETIFH
jgi:hypothetical protein